jgi:hypothetical protein
VREPNPANEYECAEEKVEALWSQSSVTALRLTDITHRTLQNSTKGMWFSDFFVNQMEISTFVD